MTDGILISAKDAHRMQNMLREFEHGGKHPKYRRRGGIAAGIKIKIFEVQSAAAGDGVYNCYEQTLDATDWTDTSGADKFDDKDATSVEVLNLLENDCLASYERMLALGDRIEAWQWIDDEGNNRWVGRPLVPSVRLARTTQAAPAATYITCNLIKNDGETEIEAGLGSGITVHCNISYGNLNTAARRLANNDYLMVQNIAGKWWAAEGFQTSEDCDCYIA